VLRGPTVCGTHPAGRCKAAGHRVRGVHLAVPAVVVHGLPLLHTQSCWEAVAQAEGAIAAVWLTLVRRVWRDVS
jgi:hypothetical protein